MKILNKIIFSLAISIIIFVMTIIKYEMICMGEVQYGYGHFLPWLNKGYSSLSYQIDALKLLLDFLIFFIGIFLWQRFIQFSISKMFKIILYVISIFTILIFISFFYLFEIYFDSIDCKIIYSSFSLAWFNH